MNILTKAKQATGRRRYDHVNIQVVFAISGVSVIFAITSPWWQVRLICLACTITMLYLASQLQSLRLYRKQQSLEGLVREQAQKLLKASALLEKQAETHVNELDVYRKTEQALVHQVNHDMLTGLANRKNLMLRLGQRLARWKQTPERQFALLFLDGDRFKLVNDSIGHTTGDKLLVEVAKRLSDNLPEGATISRQGGDEFVVLLDDVESLTEVTTIADQILAWTMTPFYIDEMKLFFNVSIGIVLGADHYQRPGEMLRDADTAMYQAKGLGKGCYQIFDATMYGSAQDELRIINGLKQAIEKDQLRLRYQPIIRLSDKSLHGFESLMRWDWADHTAVGPDVFIPLAEHNGLIDELGLWALQEACLQYKQWLHPPEFISVNISIKQLANARIVDQIERVLTSSGMKHSELKLEITETALMDNASLVRETLTLLKDKGVRLAIDDFGTGYSSLSYLHEFPADYLKIDRSFVCTIDRADKSGGKEIVKTLITLAQGLGLKTIAEGVDSKEQLDYLMLLGCDFAQGYFFAKPLHPADAEEWLESANSLVNA